MKELGQSFMEAGLLMLVITPWPVAILYGARMGVVVAVIGTWMLFTGIAIVGIHDRQKRKRHKP
jgi:hypothetical protein